MNKNSVNINKYTFFLILISFCLSVFVSKYNLFKYDKISTFEGNNYHQMIKHDPLRYMGHGSEIKDSITNNENFFELVVKIILNIYHRDWLQFSF